VPYAAIKTEWPSLIATQYKISLEQLLSYNPKNRDPDRVRVETVIQVRWTIPSSQGTCPRAISSCAKKGQSNVVAMGPDSGGAAHRGEPLLCVEVTRRTTYA
jgi:hypothetical protein